MLLMYSVIAKPEVCFSIFNGKFLIFVEKNGYAVVLEVFFSPIPAIYRSEIWPHAILSYVSACHNYFK